MRVVVTGGAGFIGANLVSRLLRETEVEQVTVVDDLSAGSLDNLAEHRDEDRLQVEIGSILDESVMSGAISDASCVVHLAARGSVPRSIVDPIGSNHVNVDGTLAVLEAIRAVRRPRPHLVFASSSSVYGANPSLPKREDMTPMPMSPYAVSKLAGEQYVLAYSRCYDVDVLPFRFFNVFGPKQPADHVYAAVVPRFIDAALSAAPLSVYGDGEQTRDFTYVGTVTEVIWTALRERAATDWPINLAYGTRTSLNELIANLEDLIGERVERVHLEPRAGDVRHSQADNGRLRAVFPSIEPTDLMTGLSETIRWHRAVRSASERAAQP
jgi:UDP-glucose 4-epimerase